MPDQSSNTRIPRFFAALPDALTSSVFLIAWILPDAVGAQRIKDLMLTMVIEFIVMHSSAFYAVTLGLDVSRLKRALILTGLSGFYLIFILGFSYGFKSTWPIWTFGWLFASRFWHLWASPAADGKEASVMMTSWLISAMAYLGGVFATIFLPLPAFGITPSVIASLNLSGISGLWVEKPYIVLAFGAFYFAVLALSKYKPLTFMPAFGRPGS